MLQRTFSLISQFFIAFFNCVILQCFIYTGPETFVQWNISQSIILREIIILPRRVDILVIALSSALKIKNCLMLFIMSKNVNWLKHEWNVNAF